MAREIALDVTIEHMLRHQSYLFHITLHPNRESRFGRSAKTVLEKGPGL